MPKGRSRCGCLALFSGGGNRVESDVGEEDDRSAGQHARPAIGHEGMPVDGLDEAGSGKNESQDSDDLDQNENVVGAGRLADTAHQNHRQDHNDKKRWNVESEMPAGRVEIVAAEVLQSR